MKQCTEDPELKLQGNKQALVYSGIKDIVKVSSGETSDTRTHTRTPHREWVNLVIVSAAICTTNI